MHPFSPSFSLYRAYGACDGTKRQRGTCDGNCKVPGRQQIVNSQNKRGGIFRDIYFGYCDGTYRNALGQYIY
jgi:hypothetical protein